jgi:uncharacterized protein (TIGR01244 family)
MIESSHRLIGVLMIALLVGACATTPEPDRWPDIAGAMTPEPKRMVSGQPSPAELVAAERAGVRHIVNARDIGEFDAWDEGELVDSLAMTYHRVPIGSTDDLDRDAVETFDRILAEIGDDPALLHCKSGNRIGALYALRAAWIEGEGPERAIEIGKAHGLTSLESAVREKLDIP